MGQIFECSSCHRQFTCSFDVFLHIFTAHWHADIHVPPAKLSSRLHDTVPYRLPIQRWKN